MGYFLNWSVHKNYSTVVNMQIPRPYLQNSDLVDPGAQIDLDGSWTAVWELHLQAVFQAGTTSITLAEVWRRNWGWEAAGESGTRRKTRELLQYFMGEMTFTTQFSCNSCFCGPGGSLSGGCPKHGKLTPSVLCSLQCPPWFPVIPYCFFWVNEGLGCPVRQASRGMCILFYWILQLILISFLLSWIWWQHLPGDSAPRCPWPLPDSVGPVLACFMLLSFSVSLCLSLKVFLHVFSPSETGQLVFPEHSYIYCILLGNMLRCNNDGRTNTSEG